MQEKFSFILSQYAFVVIFACAFYGYGKLWDKILHTPLIADHLLRTCLRIAVGMGLFIVGLQIIGATGYLKKDVIRALIMIGLALILFRNSSQSTLTGSTASGFQRNTWNSWFNIAALFLLLSSLATVIDKPLLPATEWDDLMYHLPHVREWLFSKKISINESIRYSYFPYNFDLLYAAVIGSTQEQNSHLMHAFAGWLVTVLLFRVTQNNHGPIAASIAVIIWISASKWFFKTSYIELGLALFIFSSATYFIIWLQDENKTPATLISSAFLLGLAAGAKYQAAVYVPFFIITAFLYERRLSVWSKTTAAFLLPCVYWYIRNTVLTGNPVTPLAGNIFGYYDWSAADFAYQLFDLRNSKSWPQPEIWLSLLAILTPYSWKNTSTRWLVLLSLYSAVIWYITSHYDRYLVPQYPILAMLGAFSFCHVLSSLAPIFGKSPGILAIKSSNVAGKTACALAAIIFFGYYIPLAKKSLENLPVTAEEKHVYISERAKNFGILINLQVNHPNAKVYQIGLEGGLFYGPRNIYGDHFGRWRYNDFKPLPPKQLHEKLSKQGFEILAVNQDSVQGFERQKDFSTYFQEIAQANGDKAYRLRQADDSTLPLMGSLH